MKPIVIRRTISCLAITTGIGWIWTTWAPFARDLVGDLGGGEYSSLSFSFAKILLAMSVPGIFSILGGIYLFRVARVSSVKIALAGFAIFGALAISAGLRTSIFNSFPQKWTYSLCMLIGALIVFPVYLFAVQQLLSRLGVYEPKKPKLSGLIGRGSLTVFAALSWRLLSALFDEYTPIEDGFTHVPKEPWGILGVVIPIAVAFGGYRWAVDRFVEKENAKTKRESI